jgi:hypothetical protein
MNQSHSKCKGIRIPHFVIQCLVSIEIPKYVGIQVLTAVYLQISKSSTW